MTEQPDVETVARWMVDEVTQEEHLYQYAAVYDIREKFGDQFTYMNDSGNLAIDKKVLSRFKKLTERTIVWSKSEKCWRKRHEGDQLGRAQE